MRGAGTWVVWTALLLTAGCSTTASLQDRPERALYGYASGDKAMVVWGEDSPKPGKKEWIRISTIDGAGITGTGEDGRLIDAEYGDFQVFGIEAVPEFHDESLSKLEKVADATLWAVVTAVFVPAAAAACVGSLAAGSPACLEVLANAD